MRSEPLSRRSATLSDEAVEAAVAAVDPHASAMTGALVGVRAAYPIIRADVVAEVAEFIEREFGA